MRILSYRAGGEDRAGVETDAGVLDAADLLSEPAITVRELLAGGRVGELAERAGDGGAEPLASGELEPQPPEVPAIFAKFRNALVPSGAEVSLPASSEKVDYEAEIALSARDLQFATPQWMPGKVFDGSAPCGPALVTPDEAGAHGAIEFKLELNDEVMQEATTGDLIFPIPELISHLSRWMTLEPGDVVSTGTPSGVGSARQPRVWLKPGDEIAVSSPTLGRLETSLA